MKRCMARVSVLLLTSILVSCGGGGGDGSGGGTGPSAANGGGGTPPAGTPPAGNPPGGTPPSGGGTTSAPVTTRFEESDATVSMSAGWTPSDSIAGWSGGRAVQSTVAGATVSFTFTGTSVRWIGSRGRGMGKRFGQGGRRSSQRGEPVCPPERRSAHAYRHVLRAWAKASIRSRSRCWAARTAQATSNVVVVDAFDVHPQIVSHMQDTDPDLAYSGSWTVDDKLGWSGSGATQPRRPTGGSEGYRDSRRESHAEVPRNVDHLARLSRPGRRHRACNGGWQVRRSRHVCSDDQGSGRGVHGNRTGGYKPHVDDQGDRPEKRRVHRCQDLRRRVRRDDAGKALRGRRPVDDQLFRQLDSPQRRQSLERRGDSTHPIERPRPPPSASSGPR